MKDNNTIKIKNNTKQIKNDLPELLKAVVNHPDCPDWLASTIIEEFRERSLLTPYTANYFRVGFESVEETMADPKLSRVVSAYRGESDLSNSEVTE